MPQKHQCHSWLPLLIMLMPLAGQFSQATGADVTPLPNAHAHNDYEHRRPLLDALEQGFCSVEADIFLVNGELLVAHTFLDLKGGRTLQKLYLDPLRERIQAQAGLVYRDGPHFYLLIDIKTDAKTTYAELAKLLAKYPEVFTKTEKGQTTRGPVTAVISGNYDRETILASEPRFASVDGRPDDLRGTTKPAEIPWVSDSWKSHFTWDGTGPQPDAERQKLRAYTAKAHEQGRLVRFWGAPDRQEIWQAQYENGVDLINTDKLPELRKFLLSVVPQP
ncbi:MAG: phosphatidylinositol-specific phospholipase C/glycerophosphodiester phosphodiesterase family protein [Pirellulales bacterium]|nr:phosphatidylinositol-specific phospholipase C/glycerophosphodiester phosphodiesterase family protein [Pirellulales bacterium]